MSRVRFRIEDMLSAISDIRSLLAGKQFDEMYDDRVLRAAFARFLEIISEASRHIPDDPNSLHPTIPWQNIADTGNHLRHAYHRVDARLLWNVYENDSEPLSEALNDILSRLSGDRT